MSGTQCTISELLEGQKFVFRICAINNIGQGPYSETKEPTLIRDPVSPPDPPVHLRVSGITGTTVSLLWNLPQFLGNLPLKTYTIEKLQSKFISPFFFHSS